MDGCLTSCFEIEFKHVKGDQLAHDDSPENGHPSEKNCGYKSRSLHYQHSWRLLEWVSY